MEHGAHAQLEVSVGSCEKFQKEAMATRSSVSLLSVEELSSLLSEKVDVLEPGTLEVFKAQKITGATFLELGESDLKEFVPTLGERKAIQRLMKEYQPSVS